MKHSDDSNDKYIENFFIDEAAQEKFLYLVYV